MTTAIRKFEIRLEHDIDEQYQYEPGEILRGDVLIQLSQDTSIKSIQVQIKGEASVALEEDNGNSNSTNQARASEIYVDSSFYIYGDEKSPVQSVERGEHSFVFDFTLPESLPSSFIGKQGSITYVVKATLQQTYNLQPGLGSMLTSEPFLVLRRLDISKMPELNKPRRVSLSKRSACGLLICHTGKLDAVFEINKTGFLPGEDIFINGELLNGYPETVKSIQALLFLISSFHAKNQVKKNNQVVNKKTDNVKVDYQGTRTWSNIRLSIPPFIPESRLKGCVLIDIDYLLQFRVEFEDGDEVEAGIPITIGTSIEDRSAGKKAAWDPEKYAISTGENYDLSHGIGKSGIAFSDVDLHVNEEDMEKFRHPMAEGQTRENMLFDADIVDD